VFRRAVGSAVTTGASTAEVKPVAVAPAQPQTPDEDASQSAGARRMLKDNGVEELSDVSGLTSSLRALALARKSGKSDD
jgi:hypothetical protein